MGIISRENEYYEMKRADEKCPRRIKVVFEPVLGSKFYDLPIIFEFEFVCMVWHSDKSFQNAHIYIAECNL